MTLPTEYPSGFKGTSADFAKAKADRSGALRSTPFHLTTSTAILTSGTVIGLVPVRKGARIHLPACSFACDDLDTGNAVTCALGIVYDDATNNTSVPDKYVATGNTFLQSASTSLTTLSTTAANEYVVTGDGWLALTTATASTTTVGTIHGIVAIAYDGL